MWWKRIPQHIYSRQLTGRWALKRKTVLHIQALNNSVSFDGGAPNLSLLTEQCIHGLFVYSYSLPSHSAIDASPDQLLLQWSQNTPDLLMPYDASFANSRCTNLSAPVMHKPKRTLSRRWSRCTDTFTLETCNYNYSFQTGNV